ncbi:MAG: hypothetical protein AAFP68_12935 [Pseudomonadota bacterium]
MTRENDIVAVAAPDGPDLLSSEELDAFSAGAYGGHNSCEPYAGDNTCETPAAGRVQFQTLPIERTDARRDTPRGLTVK